MENLPIEVLSHILSYMRKEDQLLCSNINKSFFEACYSPVIWNFPNYMFSVRPHTVHSFTRFLSKIAWLRNLNIFFRPTRSYERKIKVSEESILKVDLSSILNPLFQLKCLTIRFEKCKCILPSFPSSLQHLTMYDSDDLDISFINDETLAAIGNSCKHLSHLQISANDNAINNFSHDGLCYLLDSLKSNLRSIIFEDNGCMDPNPFFYFKDIPERVEFLIIRTSLFKAASLDNFFDLPNLENVKILFLQNYFPSIEDIKESNKYLKSLKILHLEGGILTIDNIMALLKKCPSLNTIYWNQYQGYLKQSLDTLESFHCRKGVKIYLNGSDRISTGKQSRYTYPNFPHESFLSLESFPKFVNKVCCCSVSLTY